MFDLAVYYSPQILLVILVIAIVTLVAELIANRPHKPNYSLRKRT